MAKNRFTLLLIKKGIPEDQVLKSGLDKIALDDDFCLHYKPMSAKAPKWIDTFLLGDEKSKEIFKVRSVSAIMLFTRNYEHETRIFAIPFGSGRNLISKGVIEERFGLVTALSAIDKDKLRSIDTSSLESVLLNSRMQTSALSGIANFYVDFNRDLLKSVTGRYEKGDEDGTLSGRDSLSFSSSANYKTIVDEIDWYYKEYKSEKYKEHFKWIDKIQVIKDSSFVEKLNNEILVSINKGELNNIWIAIPDIVNWRDLDHFKFGRQSFLEDVDIQIVRNQLIRKGVDVTLEEIKSRKIYAYNEADYLLGSWPVYKCLYVDLPLGNKQYFLNEGTWYCIDVDFVNEINEFYMQVPLCTEKLPDYDTNLEDTYNTNLVNTDKERYFHMDKRLVKVDKSTFEMCDILTCDKKLLHIKHFTSSAVLSHLFNQGLVSAECLKDKNFGPRSPMLYVIQHGYNGVRKEKPENIVYCVVRINDLVANNVDCVFTDGHAISSFTRYYGKEQLSDLDSIVSYKDVYSTFWNVDDDPDLKRRKEAELLIKGDLPIQYVCGYVVYNEMAKDRLVSKGVAAGQIAVKPGYYF